MCVYFIVFAFLVFFAPNLLNDLGNWVPANPLVTPASIVPQWYFLPFFAILRSVPDKLGGVTLMFGSIGVLFALPWLDTSPVRSARFRPVFRPLMFLLVGDILLLGAVGAHEPIGLWILLGRFATLCYFFHFLVLLPLVGALERPLPLPVSIGAPVLGRSRDTVGSLDADLQYPGGH